MHANQVVIIGIETRQGASSLVYLGFACRNFTKKNKRLLAVYHISNEWGVILQFVRPISLQSHAICLRVFDYRKISASFDKSDIVLFFFSNVKTSEKPCEFKRTKLDSKFDKLT